MGTDINLKVQVQDPVTSVWRTVKTDYHEHRNYDLFAILAGVRNHRYAITPIMPYRDPPPDLAFKEYHDWHTYRSYYDAEGNYLVGDDEGLYWYTLQELYDFNWDVQAGTSGQTYSELAGDFRATFMETLSKLGPMERVRIIFSFSS